MPTTARRLARRYLPLRVRRAVHELTSTRTAGPQTSPQGGKAKSTAKGTRPAPQAKPAPGSKRAPKPASAVKPKSAAKPAATPPPVLPPLVVALEQGQDLTSAVMAHVRWLVEKNESDRAVSIGESLLRQEATRTVGALASAVTAFQRGYAELAWHHFASVPRELWGRYASREYLRAALVHDGKSALQIVSDLLADEPAGMDAESWYRLLETTYGMGEGELARQVFARFEQRLDHDANPWGKGEQLRSWMTPWVAADPDSPTAPSADGRRTFAVMDYGHPGVNRGSANIGDHVQTIASLGHLVRHQEVRFHGDESMIELLHQLRNRVRPERQLKEVTADIEVMTVHRDASMYEPVPEDTWMLCFGWFMHALFDMRYGFPLHKNLRPIFVSFHCNKRELLTPEAVEYLRTYGPIGCRDWTTTYLLTSLDIPAFFSGCLTTTIDTVFPELPVHPSADAPCAYVDVPAAKVPAGAPTFKHSDVAVRSRSFIQNVYSAVDLLENYRRNHSAVVTSRLHCYLPVRSLGMPVEFTPKNDSDIRFDGLINITDDDFAAIRDGILAKLEQVFTLMLGGASEEEIYAQWRQLTASDVEAARERLHVPSSSPRVSFDVTTEAARVTAQTLETPASSASSGRPVEVAVPFSASRVDAFAALVASIVENTERPTQVWVMADKLPDDGGEALGNRFPTVGFHWVPTKGVASSLRPLTGTSASRETIDKLLLANLVPGVGRIVMLPSTAVVTADIGELYDLDLGGFAFAAASTTGTTRGGSGFGVIHNAALRLQHRTQAAAALRRTAHARHEFDFDSFSDQVLVIDLDRWRNEAFADEALGLVEGYGLNAREVLHYLAGPHRAEVPRRWATAPTRLPIEQPGLLFWPDKVKPWDTALTPGRDLWRSYANPA